jgi:endogenous inhibitor of DNA gyrase (YacG/DUF329 family)
MTDLKERLERIGPGAVGMEISHMKTCARCGSRYDWRKSQSTNLKMTYCSSLCERGDLGFTIDALLALEPIEAEEAEAEVAAAV